MFRLLAQRVVPSSNLVRGGRPINQVRFARVVRGPLRKKSPAATVVEEGSSSKVTTSKVVEKVEEDIEDQFDAINTSHLTPLEAVNTDNTSSSWSWVPPVQKGVVLKTIEKNKIPIKKGVLLSVQEVELYLKSNGAENVVVIHLKEPLDTIRYFIIASASSTRLIRRLLETVVDVLKKRELHQVIGSTGIEGSKTDDWQIVDCHSFLLHMMLPDTRKHLDLESHWSMKERPYLPSTDNALEYDKQFNKLLDQYPVPDEYMEKALSGDDNEPGRSVKVL
eukprot:gene9576-10583_t